MSRLATKALVISILFAASSAMAEGDKVASENLETESQEASRPPRPGSLDTGFGFGLGLSYYFDRQTSLVSTFDQSTVTLRDLDTGIVDTTVFDVDPKLNNRKLDFELELEGPGLYIPIDLPKIPGIGGGSLYPTLGFEVTAADVTFDSVEKARGELSSSLGGSGEMFGVGLDLTTRVRSSGKWFAGWSYWFRTLSSIDVGRAVPIGGPKPIGEVNLGLGSRELAARAAADLEILFDKVALSRETHEVSVRTGYAESTGKWYYAPYTGVLFRWTDIEIEDEIRFREPSIGLETTQETMTRFESETVQGIVGFEARLSESFFGRAESYFGEGDYGTRLQFAWKVGGGPGPSPTDTPPPPPKELEKPHLLTFTSRLLEARGPVRGGWPVVVDYQLERDGFIELEIDIGSHSKIYRLRGKAGGRKDRIRKLGRKFGREPRMATLTIRAFDKRSRESVNYRFHGLGAGRGAIASTAIKPDGFDPPKIDADQTTSWNFHCLGKFHYIKADVYKRLVEDKHSGIDLIKSKLIRSMEYGKGVDRLRCPLTPDTRCAGEWDGRTNPPPQLSVGTHVLTITVSNTDTEDWDIVAVPKAVEVR